MKNYISGLIAFTFACMSFSLNAYANEDLENHIQEKYIAIVIDDFGNGTKDTMAMIDLSIPFTAAVMPNLEFSVEEMEKLRAAGKDVIVHMPMEPEKGNASWLGKGAITVSLTDEEIRQNVMLAFDQLEHAVGLNNHMGSKITKNAEIMKEIISVVKEKDLIMLDSVTTDKSKIEEICKDSDVKFLKRDVFLDAEGKHDVSFVEKRMLETSKIAKEKGYAIAIGHVGNAGGLDTVKGITNMVPKLEAEGIKFVTISELYDILY